MRVRLAPTIINHSKYFALVIVKIAIAKGRSPFTIKRIIPGIRKIVIFSICRDCITGAIKRLSYGIFPKHI
jgi:hypothetical protein